MVGNAVPARQLAPSSSTPAVGRDVMQMFRVVGGSMTPALAAGDLVAAEACHGAELRDGDLVVMQDHAANLDAEAVDGEQVLVVHRLLGKLATEEGYLLRTRGDNRLADDRLWTERELVGKVARTWRSSETGYRLQPEGPGRNRWHAALGRTEDRALRVAHVARVRLLGRRAVPGTALLARAIHGVVHLGHLLLNETARPADSESRAPV
jgi:signal peptidase I